MIKPWFINNPYWLSTGSAVRFFQWQIISNVYYVIFDVWSVNIFSDLHVLSIVSNVYNLQLPMTGEEAQWFNNFHVKLWFFVIPNISDNEPNNWIKSQIIDISFFHQAKRKNSTLVSDVTWIRSCLGMPDVPYNTKCPSGSCVMNKYLSWDMSSREKQNS